MYKKIALVLFAATFASPAFADGWICRGGDQVLEFTTTSIAVAIKNDPRGPIVYKKGENCEASQGSICFGHSQSNIFFTIFAGTGTPWTFSLTKFFVDPLTGRLRHVTGTCTK